MPTSIRPGDTLAGRYRLDDLLSESGAGRFWLAHDHVLQRHVALHVIGCDDERSPGLLEAARRSATVVDPRILRVLDAQMGDRVCFVVNEWGLGTSLDIALANNGPLLARTAAWMVAEVADSVAVAHAHGVHHGRLTPENVLVDTGGGIRIIGFAVDAALHGLPPGAEADDVRDLGGLLHAALTGTWGGPSASSVRPAPRVGDRVLRPRQVRAGVPRPLDDLVDELLNPPTGWVPGDSHLADAPGPVSAAEVAALLLDFVGDPAGLPEALAAANPVRDPDVVVLEPVPDIPLRFEPLPAPRRVDQAPGPTPDVPPDTAAPDQAAGSDDTATGLDPVDGPKPLFAPEPQGDSGARERARAERAARAGDRGHAAESSTSATSLTRPVRPPGFAGDLSGASRRRPGQPLLRAAAVVGLVLLLVVVAAIVWSAVTSEPSTVDESPTGRPAAAGPLAPGGPGVPRVSGVGG